MKKKILLLALAALSAGVWGQKNVNRADILLLPEWQQVYDATVPEAAAVASLRSKVPGLRADVYFGSWCDDSKNNVPLFLKIIDSINEPEFKVSFHTVEKKPATGQKYFVEDVLVEKVPTFIFYRNDVEIGRIIENPKESMLQDMMQIVL
jgi:hypothetical protein